MSHYKPYPAYKDSGVEWLGEVPEHWENARLRWLSTRYAGGTPDRLNLDYWTEGNIPWINSGAVNQLLISEPSAYITEAAYKNSSAKWIPAEALVMALAGQGRTKGMVAQLAIPTTCNQSMAAIIPNQELVARFLFWWLTSNYQNIRNMAGGDLRDGLNLELLGDVACPVAPFSEQQTITAFLDRETAKIDTLISKQEKLIELLKEKRQAVISHAVTKGLNPKAKMKDSGVEWIGEVPEEWSIPTLKHLVATPITDGPHETPVKQDVGIKFISAESLSSGRINFSKAWGFISKEDNERFSRKYKPQRNDIYMIKSGATTGVVAIVEDDMEFNIWSPLAAIRPSSNTFPRFLLYALRSSEFQAGVALNWSYGTQQNIGMSVLEALPVPIPSLEKQRSISDYLDRETAKIDTLISKSEKAIELQKEHRTTLISAAVTGKIDVRGAT